MSTSDRPDDRPLTRRQLRELRKTGANPVTRQEESAQPAAETAAREDRQETRNQDTAARSGVRLPRAEQPARTAPTPRPDSAVDLGARPLTRRQAREQEKLRTNSVPVVSEPEAAASAAQSGESPAADSADAVGRAAEAETATGDVDATAEETAADAQAGADATGADCSAENAAAGETTPGPHAGADATGAGPQAGTGAREPEVESSGEEAEREPADTAQHGPADTADVFHAVGTTGSVDAGDAAAPADAAAVSDEMTDGTAEADAATAEAAASNTSIPGAYSNAGAHAGAQADGATGARLLHEADEGTAATGEGDDRGENGQDQRFRPVVNPTLGDKVLQRASRTGETRQHDGHEDSSGSTRAPSTLILTEIPGHDSFSGPVTATGEIIMTNSHQLPDGFGSRGHAKGTTDGKESDAVLLDGEIPASSSPTPIAASSAISTSKAPGEVIRPPAPEKGGRLVLTLAITAGVLAVALIGAFGVAFASGVFG